MRHKKIIIAAGIILLGIFYMDLILNIRAEREAESRDPAMSAFPPETTALMAYQAVLLENAGYHDTYYKRIYMKC